MPWPLASQFSAMVQNPRVAFRDAALQCCTIERNDLRQPRTWSGAFAVVYKAVDPQGKPRAVRVFTSECSERQNRYGQISAHLEKYRANCLVDFQYQQEGIRAPGGNLWHPIVVMDWVEGKTLYRWLREKCLSFNHSSIAKAARHWLRVVNELTDARVAHGDLQHGNVMVTPSGALKLVDYDGLCVPKLIGARNLEVGLPPYQHPWRDGTTKLDLSLDHFAGIVIYLVLRSLSVDSSLWAKYVEEPCYDKLLLRPEDLARPESSPLYADLTRSPDSLVRRLTRALFDIARRPMAQTPPLEELIAACEQRGGWRPASAPAASLADGEAGAVVALEVIAGPMKGEQFVFQRHETFLFGRGRNCHARLNRDQQVSRHQFLLEVNPPAVRLRDLGSLNGTEVNGRKCGGRDATEDVRQAASRRYPEVDLKDGDTIGVGDTHIRVRIETGARRDETILLKVGGNLDDYDRVAPLPHGPASAVYRAIRKHDGLPVVLKLIAMQPHADPLAVERAIAGLNLVFGLTHPNVAAIVDFGLAGGRFFVVSQHVAGGSLQDRMASSSGPPPIQEMLTLVEPCLEALQLAHERGIVHGDIKPGNLLLAHEGRQLCAKLCDFGVRLVLDKAGLAGMTASAAAVRECCFTPRERWTGFAGVGPTSDLYSLAATFYYALTNRFVYDFGQKDPIAVVLNETPVLLRDRLPAIPEAIAEVMNRALRPEPAERFPSASAMLTAWRKACGLHAE